MKIHAKSLSFSYGKKSVLEKLSFSLANKELLAVMGESGCGKSTLLHLIAGLRRPNDGALTVNAEQIAYVFQEPRLFPWLTVRENLLAVLPKKTTADAENSISEALAAVELTDAQELYPRQLSGGMKSRVALARAMVYGGDLFLLDEPFSALDEAMRRKLTANLRKYFKDHGISAILVTHHSTDAEDFADRILQL